MFIITNQLDRREENNLNIIWGLHDTISCAIKGKQKIFATFLLKLQNLLSVFLIFCFCPKVKGGEV